MKTGNITTAFSTSSTSDSAVKEISRDIKAVTGAKPISLSLLFFTPQYQPLIIKEVINITLRPRNIFAIQVPMVIFQSKALRRGIICCCFSKPDLQLKSIFIKDETESGIETIFRKNILGLKSSKRIILSAIGPQMNVRYYIRALELSSGKNSNIFGAGFMKKYGIDNSQILNETIGEGISSMIIGSDIEINSAQTGGFLPIGRKFVITKISTEENRIIKIDDKPAAFIYRKYMQDKFDFFRKTDFCSFYPMGIKDAGDSYRIIQVRDFLEDDSILYFGEIKEGEEANIMMSTPRRILDEVKRTALRIRSRYDYNLVIVLDSILRRRILKTAANREIEMIKEILGEKTKLIGLYCDYQIFPGEYSRRFSIENYQLSIMLLNDRTG